MSPEERTRRALVRAAGMPDEVARRLGIGIRSEGRRALNARLESETKGRTITSGIVHPPDRQKIKKPWSPIREACAIVAIFSQRLDDGRWVINPDAVTRQDRKAARQLLRSVGGVVG